MFISLVVRLFFLLKINVYFYVPGTVNAPRSFTVHLDEYELMSSELLSLAAQDCTQLGYLNLIAR